MRNIKVGMSIVFALALASATLCGSAIAQTMGEYGGVTAGSASHEKCFRSDTDFGPGKDFGPDKDFAPVTNNQGNDFKNSDFKSDQNLAPSNNSSSDFKSSDFGSSQNFGSSKW